MKKNQKEKIKKIIDVLPMVAFVFFLTFAALNFVIADEFYDHADKCYDLANMQRTGAISNIDGEARFVELANEQFQLMQVDQFDCYKYPLWKIGLLKIEAPYTTYGEAVKGQVG